jgi:hypothetical protein
MKKKITTKKGAAKPKAAPKAEPPKAVPIKARFNTDAALAAQKRHAELRDRSRRWAELHANPKTRSKMDALLDGLTAREARTVYLNGQRMSCGMQPKDYS